MGERVQLVVAGEQGGVGLDCQFEDGEGSAVERDGVGLRVVAFAGDVPESLRERRLVAIDL